jgi:hypothetical protein
MENCGARRIIAHAPCRVPQFVARPSLLECRPSFHGLPADPAKTGKPAAGRKKARSPEKETGTTAEKETGTQASEEEEVKPKKKPKRKPVEKKTGEKKKGDKDKKKKSTEKESLSMDISIAAVTENYLDCSSELVEEEYV